MIIVIIQTLIYRSYNFWGSINILLESWVVFKVEIFCKFTKNGLASKIEQVNWIQSLPEGIVSLSKNFFS